MRDKVPKHIQTIQTCSFFGFAVIIAVLLSLVPFPVRGEIQTITRTVKEEFGGSRSPDDALVAAVARARNEALEMAGVYVESFTIVKDFRVDKDGILDLTAGVLKTEVVSQKNYHTDNAFGVEVVVRIDVDTSVLEDRVKKLLADRTLLGQLNQARNKEKELLDKNAKLEEENKRFMAENKTSKQLENQFKDTSQGLTAIDWFYKALAGWQNRKFPDRIKVIEYLSEAIRLKPDDADVYNNRGLAYLRMGNTTSGCNDLQNACNMGNCMTYK